MTKKIPKKLLYNKEALIAFIMLNWEHGKKSAVIYDKINPYIKYYFSEIQYFNFNKHCIITNNIAVANRNLISWKN